jgi:STE24 endopeptidase
VSGEPVSTVSLHLHRPVNEDKGTRYRRAERTLRVLEVTAATAVLGLVAISPLPGWLRTLDGRSLSQVHPSLVATGLNDLLPAACILAVSLAGAALGAAPFAMLRQGSLAGRYNLPTVTAGAHARGLARRGFVLVIAGVAAWWVFARIAGRAPWLAGIGLSLSILAVATVVMLLAPWVILLSPRVKPLRDEAITGRLHALAARAQLRLAGLHEWVFGPRGDHANAALVGVVGPRRLLISDTLIAGCPPEEMDAVVAHELGHHRHGHTWQRVRSQATSLVLAVLAAQACATGPARWIGGTGGLADPASLPWMLLGAGAVWLASRPWHLALSRAHEAEADAFALELTGRADVLERVLTRIGARNLSSDDDSLLTRAFFLTHPPIPTRIAAARRAAGTRPSLSS